MTAKPEVTQNLGGEGSSKGSIGDNTPGTSYATRSRLKIRGLSAILPVMAAARIAAVFFIALTTALVAQSASKGKVVITVTDQAGAVLAGARVGVSRAPSTAVEDPLSYARHAQEEVSTHANAYGEATVDLPKGSYAVLITSEGFKAHIERIEIRGDSNQSLRAMLAIDSTPLGPRVDPTPLSWTYEIPLEPISLNISIPLEPLQTITPTAARARRRWPRF